jgi:hypothetical protein
MKNKMPNIKNGMSKYMVTISSDEGAPFNKAFKSIEEAKEYGEKEFLKYVKQHIVPWKKFNEDRGLKTPDGSDDDELRAYFIGRNKKESQEMKRISRMYKGPIECDCWNIEISGDVALTFIPAIDGVKPIYSWLNTDSVPKIFSRYAHPLTLEQYEKVIAIAENSGYSEDRRVFDYWKYKGRYNP